MKRLFPLIYLLILSLVFPFSVRGEEIKAPQEKEEVLKERQHFNKLKRSTRNIYKVTMRPSVVYRLQTALGYISTIDLPEPALKVFIGDQEQFRVEVYEKQVLVKPITDELEARTNLVIVTGSSRLSFDVSVGPPETADFVLDFRLPQDDSLLVQNAFEKKVEEKTKELEKTYQEKEKKLEEKAEKLSEEKLKVKIASEAKTIKLKASAKSGEVQVNLLSLSQVGNKAYLRFSVLNYSKTPYRMLRVVVGAFQEERKLLKKTSGGIIEFSSEVSLPQVINPDRYEYGVVAFDYRPLGKKEKSLFRLMEDTPESRGGQMGGRSVEIKGYPWLE